MNQTVLAVSAAKFKVLKAIVISDLVNVMNLLLLGEKPFQVSLHHKSMFLHIASAIAIRVIPSKHSNVSIGVPVGLSRFAVGFAFHENSS